MTTKKKIDKVPANEQKGTKKCTKCGNEKKYLDFYSSASPLYSSDKRIPICKDCIRELCVNSKTGEINELELNKTLRIVQKPFFKDDLASAYAQFSKENSYIADEDVKKYGDKILGLYFKNTMLRQNKNLSYDESEKLEFMHSNSNIPLSTKQKIAEKYMDINKEKKCIQDVDIKSKIMWTKKDKQNMNYVISTVGYDPFDDLELSESDRKHCFNIMAGYCDTAGIVEDGNKTQGVVEMTNMYCQCKNLTAAINAEMNKDNPDDQKISRLTSSKTSMLSSISTIAKDNNISSNYNKNSKQGQNSITSKMKEMEENDFEMIKVNLFDIKTSEAFKQIADLSNQSIMDQLTFDNNDYTEIVKEQREMIQSFEIEVDSLNEENRNLKNKIIDLENRKR